MKSYPKSAEIFERNRRYIPGGVVSVNRAIQPEIAFVKGEGAFLWDADGNRFLDYHFAFAPHFLGHNDLYVTGAVRRVLDHGLSLYGSGTTELEGRLAELVCANCDFVDSIQALNTGSEATYQAIRVARAATGRDHIVVMQGGYNGWHNDVACNLMTPLERLGPRVSPGEYPFVPISAGIPAEHQRLVHPINFNDLESVEWVAQRYPIACLIAEPILQNVGVVRPLPDYLQGLRTLAGRYGFILVFDEVKTGFRHSLGGYAAIAGVRPDLAVYGKAIANGYPMAIIGGRRDLMDYFVHPEPSKRVLLAGTYNAHPVPTAAAIATIERLQMNGGEAYRHVEALGRQMEDGLCGIFRRSGVEAVVARQGSAFCVYFMDHLPVDWHDLAAHHDSAFDEAMRRALIEEGVYFFPLATKQCSISVAHTREDVTFTLEAVERVLRKLAPRPASAR
ncbi:MAG: aminotransferase class III-fold pyridoxal phosphate-dependent enzyme [Bryobacteraceae bacterium]|nr:aminotransferase class III-fold pyridoxal phosphate-dependent enzyme [Bryobacteraceae bacterium]